MDRNTFVGLRKAEAGGDHNKETERNLLIRAHHTIPPNIYTYLNLPRIFPHYLRRFSYL